MKIENKIDGRVVGLSPAAKTREAVLKNLNKSISKTTKELVEETGKNGCYEACRYLEKIGVLESNIERKYTLWDPITKQVVTKENHDLITINDGDYMEKLRDKYKAKGMSDQEIEDRLEIYHLCNIEVPYRSWWLSKNWIVLED